MYEVGAGRVWASTNSKRSIFLCNAFRVFLVASLHLMRTMGIYCVYCDELRKAIMVACSDGQWHEIFLVVDSEYSVHLYGGGQRDVIPGKIVGSVERNLHSRR